MCKNRHKDMNLLTKQKNFFKKNIYCSQVKVEKA